MLTKAHLFFILLSNTVIYGQINSFYPDVVRSYKNQEAWINPSSSVDTSRYHVNMVANTTSGSRGNVGLYQLYAGFALKTSEKQSQTMRIFISNEREGPYISKPRAYLSYTLRMRISQKSYLSSGISYGFSSATINASLVTNSNNYFTQDATLGITFSRKYWGLGGSILHALNNRISTSIENARLKRHYHLNGYYNIQIDYSKHLEIAGFYRVFSDLQNQFLGSLVFYPRDEFGFGTGYYSRRGISFYTYFQHIIHPSNYQLFFTYNSGWMSEVPVISRSFELGLCMLFYKK